MSIKDIEITLPDGKPAKLGGTLYEVKEGSVSRYNSSSYKVVEPYSGKSSTSIQVLKIIAINTASNARTFTVKSSKGCERMYSVRDTCITDKIFSSRARAVVECKNIDKDDIAELEKRNAKCLENIKKYRLTIALLKKAKH